MLDSEQKIKEGFDLIFKIEPDYVVISRLVEGEETTNLFHYVFVTKLLIDYKEKNPDKYKQSNTLEKFFGLDKYTGESVEQVSEKNFSSLDPKLEKIFKNIKGDDLILLSKGFQIVGIFDSKKESDSQYEMKGTGHSIKNPFRLPAFKVYSKGGSEYNPRDDPTASQMNIAEDKPKSKGGFISKGGPPPKLRSLSSPRNSEFKSEETKYEMPESEEPYKDSETTKVEKYASASLKENLKLKQEDSFVVRLKDISSKPKEGHVTSMEFEKEEGQTHAEILVTAMCTPPDAIEILGVNSHPLSVPLDDSDSDDVFFRIMPKKEGPCTMTALFFLKKSNALLGSIQAHAEIGDEVSEKESSTESRMDVNPQSSGPDLMMIIRETQLNPFKFEIQVCAHELGYPMVTFPHDGKFGGNPEEEFRALFETIEALDPKYFSLEEIELQIASIGRDLFSKLFPEDFKKFYWENKKKINTIQILSSEPWIPWEIIKPWKNKDGEKREEGYLCEEHSLTRWISPLKTIKKSKIKSIKVVQPEDTDLDGAKEESKWIKNFSDENGIRYSKDSTLEDVRASLREGDFDILHFTTHGQYNKKISSHSYIELANDKVLRPNNLTGIDVNLDKNNPLVILNACQTANQGFFLTGIGSWAQSFLEAFASGFIGTLWSVSDSTALCFSQNLYKNLKKGIPLDEAVKKARKDARKKGDPSWLAYSLYAPPNLHLLIGDIEK